MNSKQILTAVLALALFGIGVITFNVTKSNNSTQFKAETSSETYTINRDADEQTPTVPEESLNEVIPQVNPQ
jgi:hypothetical protein